LLHQFLVKDKKSNLNIFYGVIGVIVLLFSFKTFNRNFVWKNDNTLFATGIETAPNSSRTQSFYGKINRDSANLTTNPAQRKRYLETSAKYLEQSIETLPSFTETYQHLALTYEAQNRIQEAENAYKKAIENDPTYFNAMTNLGVLYYKNKNYPAAENYLNQSLALAPNLLVTVRALGLTYEAAGKYDLAIQQFEKALSLRYAEEQLVDLGKIYEKLGNPTKAMEYSEAIRKLRGN